MEKVRVSKKPRFFYGYWILVAGFLCLFIESGFSYYAFSLFVTPLQTDFGWGRGEIMLSRTIFLGIMGLTSPFVGRLVDRYEPRRVMSIGAFIGGIGFLLLTQTHNLWQFYAAYVVLGLGMNGITQVPISAVISNWFKKRRGTALGIASTGIGVGGLVLSPLVGSYLIPSFGWRVSYLVLALMTWVIAIPLALFLMRTKPADMGLYPDGVEAAEAVAESKASASSYGGLSLKMALTTSAFWLVAIGFLLSQFSQSGVVQNQAPYLEDSGFPVAIAATALGAVWLGSAIGKFFFGWLCDQIPAKYACFIGLVFQIAAIVVLMSIRPASPMAIIWLYTILMGLGMGSWLPTMAILASTNFGLASYGAIFGMLSLVQRLGAATGPMVAGYMYDALGNYHWAFIILVSLYAIAVPAILAIRQSRSIK